MKLVYANGACSLAVHILLEELGESYEYIRVDLMDKKVLESYNPLGYVPVLELDNGEIMLEATSILLYLSLEKDSAFLPREPFARAKCVEWLSFISSELHKLAGPLFHRQDLTDNYLKFTFDKLEKRLEIIDERLQNNAFLMGLLPSVADFYALAILRILEHVKVPFDHFEAIRSYKKTLEEMPSIAKVLKEEQSAPLERRVREIKPRNVEGYLEERRQ
ncbi:MAG: glutathione S-transferase N-terminal domain-containing protein [Bdellovibrionales bacterium]|nr:glutathione S-transferase N-terminal domain-containing protein [Bdellovibrionales bacterium]